MQFLQKILWSKWGLIRQILSMSQSSSVSMSYLFLCSKLPIWNFSCVFLSSVLHLHSFPFPLVYLFLRLYFPAFQTGHSQSETLQREWKPWDSLGVYITCSQSQVNIWHTGPWGKYGGGPTASMVGRGDERRRWVGVSSSRVPFFSGSDKNFHIFGVQSRMQSIARAIPRRLDESV
jgi:hypothetical protein